MPGVVVETAGLKLPRRFISAVVFLGLVAAWAQAAFGQGAAGVDLSGIYAPAPFVARPEVLEPEVYPFTEQGRQTFEAFDPLVGNPRIDDECSPETMPGVLWLGAPMQITRESDQIIMRFERGGTTRNIPIGTSGASDPEHSGLGHSVARWEDDVLIIETTHLLGGTLRNNQGYPFSREAKLTERYWREPGQMDLRLEVVVDDPVNYTETFTLGRVWIWAPDERIRQWECVSLGRGDSEVDIDELARMLEEL